MVSGIIAVGLMYLLGRRIYPGGRSRQASFFACSGLLFSYGFWRYSCETEIYSLAVMLALASLCSITHPSTSRISLFLGIIVGVISVLIHVLNAVPVIFVASLIYYFKKKEKENSLRHAGLSSLFVGCIYVGIFLTLGFQSLPDGTVKDGGISLMVLPRACVGLGQCLISANFLFSYEKIAEVLQIAFPYRIFSEELFLAHHISSVERIFFSVTFVLSIISLMILSGALILNFFRNKSYVDRWILLIWLSFGILPVFLMEPSNPELWILSLPPLWLLAGKLYSTGNRAIPWCIIGIIALHNSTAGIGLVRSKEWDYNATKAKWVIEHAQVEDVICTADSYVFFFYLNYWSRAEVINLHSGKWKNSGSGTTYFMGDCFQIPGPLLVRWSESSMLVNDNMARIKDECELIENDEFGGVWSLKLPD